MPITTPNYAFKGKGQLFLGLSDGSNAKRFVGNVPALSISVEEETDELTDYTNDAGGNYATERRISGASLSATLSDFSPENLALATFGSVSAITATTVTDEPHTARLDGLVNTDYMIDTSVPPVVTDDAGGTTYVEGADYEVNAGGIFPLSTGAITDGQTIKIDYTKLAGHDIQAMVNSAQDYTLVFVGLNSVKSGKPVVVTVHKAKFGPGENLGFITDEFGAIQLTAAIEKDTGKSSGSQYFQIQEAS